jgi:hypothetical protein
MTTLEATRMVDNKEVAAAVTMAVASKETMPTATVALATVVVVQ